MGASARGCFVHVLAMQESEADIGTIFLMLETMIFVEVGHMPLAQGAIPVLQS